MAGSGDLVASVPERWCLAREALMSESRIKSERQKSNAQNGGQEDKGVLLSCSCSDFVKILDGFSQDCLAHTAVVLPSPMGWMMFWCPAC